MHQWPNHSCPWSVGCAFGSHCPIWPWRLAVTGFHYFNASIPFWSSWEPWCRWQCPTSYKRQNLDPTYSKQARAEIADCSSRRTGGSLRSWDKSHCSSRTILLERTANRCYRHFSKIILCVLLRSEKTFHGHLQKPYMLIPCVKFCTLTISSLERVITTTNRRWY